MRTRSKKCVTQQKTLNTILSVKEKTNTDEKLKKKNEKQKDFGYKKLRQIKKNMRNIC